MATNALEIEHLEMVYPDGTHAVRDLSMAVQAGELIAVIGSSGAGKSTLMRNINRLVEPTGGSVRFFDQEVTKLGFRSLRRIRREIGMIFQHFNLVNRVSAVHNVLHGKLGYTGTLRGGFGHFTRAEVEEALTILHRVGLSDQAFKRADELSGGQKQRVGLARAISQQPRLILADEPIASLDPGASERVMRYLGEICRQDEIIAIVSLHQVEYAREFATRMIGLREGSIMFDARTEDWSDEMIDTLYA